MNIVFLKNVNKLGESGCDIYTFFIFNTENTLIKHFLDNHCKVISCRTFFYLIKIHEYGNKRSLSICSHQCDNLILNNLNSLLNLFSYTHFCDFIYLLLIKFHSFYFELCPNVTTILLTADFDKGNQMGKCNTLSTVLGTCNLGYCLCCDVTCCRKALWLLNHNVADYCSVLEHIF